MSHRKSRNFLHTFDDFYIPIFHLNNLEQEAAKNLTNNAQIAIVNVTQTAGFHMSTVRGKQRKVAVALFGNVYG